MSLSQEFLGNQQSQLIISKLVQQFKKQPDFIKYHQSLTLHLKNDVIRYKNQELGNEAKNTQNDNSFLVDRCDIHPFNSIGLIEFQTKNKQYGIGTGFLIKKNIVLTAAHNVTEIIDGKMIFYQNVYFSLQQKNKKRIYFQCEEIKYPEEYKISQMNIDLLENSSNLKKWDFALIKIRPKLMYDQNVLQIHSHLTIQKDFHSSNHDSPLIMAGFHQNQNQGIRNLLKGVVVQELQSKIQLSGSIIGQSKLDFKIHKQNLFYNSTTFKGQSGSPIMIVADKNKFQFQVIGMHVANNKKQKMNQGILFSQEIVERINFFLKQFSQSKLESLKVAQNKIITSFLIQKLKEKGVASLDKEWQLRRQSFLLQIAQKLNGRDSFKNIQRHQSEMLYSIQKEIQKMKPRTLSTEFDLPESKNKLKVILTDFNTRSKKKQKKIKQISILQRCLNFCRFF